MEIIIPSQNVQSGGGNSPKITLQAIQAEPSGFPQGWKTAYGGLATVLVGLVLQVAACLTMLVAAAAGSAALGEYAVMGVGAANGVVVLGILLAALVPRSRDLRWWAVGAALPWAGAVALAALGANEGDGLRNYAWVVLLAVLGHGSWVAYLRALGARFDAASLHRDAWWFAVILFAASAYALLLASAESRASLVENGIFGLLAAVWHLFLIRAARHAIRSGD